MRVVVALTQPPAPGGGAPGLCALGLLRGLAAHGVDVRAIAARQHFALPAEPPADLPVELVDVPPEQPGMQTRLRAYRYPRGELGRGPFAERVRDACRDAAVLHLEETETAWSGRGATIPSLVHVHYRARRDRPLGAPWRREFRDVALSSLAERWAIRNHRWLVASSPVVAETLRAEAPQAEVVVAPLSLDPSLYGRAPLDGPPVAGIIGTASWPPTADAIHRLVGDVWPRVRRLVPDARLVIAGRGSDRIGIVEADGVEVAGEIESTTEWLLGLSVLLYPVARGSGMKVKVLEAIASGVPVVTTAAGAEGVDGGDGVVVEADADAIARAAAAILGDASERRERGAAARAAFDARYAPLPATAPLVDLYRRMASA